MFKNFLNRNRRVFLDFASSTSINKYVQRDIDDYNKNNFSNPSALYKEALTSKELLEKARSKIGLVLNCQKENIIFTAGGTEANNMSILGVFEKAKESGILKPHIISSLTEHSSIREVLDEVLKRGGEVTLISPEEDGIISAEKVLENIKENTVLISLMYVNNEIGTVLDIKKIGQAIRKYKKDKNLNYPFFHTDACQAPLYYNLDTSTLNVDLMSIDGIKIYGPRSSGILYVRGDTFIKPIIFGGGQEKGLRSGTEDVAKAIGLAKSLEIAKDGRKENFEKVLNLRNYFWKLVSEEFPDSELNGSLKDRSPNNLNICFKDIDAEYLTVALDIYGVCVSYSSSCRNLKDDSSSYVIDSIGKGYCKNSSIRFTLGLETTKSDLDFAFDCLKKALIQVKK